MKQKYSLLHLIPVTLLMLVISGCSKEVGNDDYEGVSASNSMSYGIGCNAVKAFETPDGGYLVIGNTYVVGKQYDVFCTKLNKFGVIENTKQYGGSSDDVIVSAVQDRSGNILAVGKTTSDELSFAPQYEYTEEYLFLYLDINGNLIRQKAFADTAAPFALANFNRNWANQESAFDVIAADDGSFWVCGTSRAYRSDTTVVSSINRSTYYGTLLHLTSQQTVSDVQAFSLPSSPTTMYNASGVNLTQKANGEFDLILTYLPTIARAGFSYPYKLVHFNAAGDSIHGYLSPQFSQAAVFGSNMGIENADGSYSYINTSVQQLHSYTNNLTPSSSAPLSPSPVSGGLWLVMQTLTTPDAIYLAGSEAPPDLLFSFQDQIQTETHTPLLVKMNRNGQVLWSRKINTMNGAFFDIIQRRDGTLTAVLSGRNQSSASYISLFNFDQNGLIK